MKELYRNLIRIAREEMGYYQPHDWEWISCAMDIHHYIKEIRKRQ